MKACHIPAVAVKSVFGTFAPLPTGPLERYDLLPSRKLALGRLCQYAARRGIAWCGVATLARGIGMSPSTTRRALRDLEKRGLVLTCLRRGRSSVYRLVGGGHPGQVDCQRDQSDLDLIPLPALEDFLTEGAEAAPAFAKAPRRLPDASPAPAPAPECPKRSLPAPRPLPGRFLGVTWAIWERVHREHRGREYARTPFDGKPMILVAQATLAAVHYDHAAARELLEHRFVQFLADRTPKLNDLGHALFLLPQRLAGYGWPKRRAIAWRRPVSEAPARQQTSREAPAAHSGIDMAELARRAAAWRKL